MDLLEYQAKELFQEIGIPILPSQPIHDPTELKRLHIPYPIVLKSQVRAGGRGRSGGIRFVENTIDAIAAARAIFNLPILGEYPEVILAEARYYAQQEFFLGIVLDYQLQRPILLGSAYGGMNIETLLENMHKVVIDQTFSPFYARRLVKKMGVEEDLVQSVTAIVEKMYDLFRDNDLDLIEINPLGVSATGEVMALDGKISVNDYAINRHSQLITLTQLQKPSLTWSMVTLTSNSSEKTVPLKGFEAKNKQGNTGIISNSLGLALSTWDLLVQDKLKPACCLVIEDNSFKTSLRQQLEIGLEKMSEVPGLQVILINILGSPEVNQIVAEVISQYFQPLLKQQLNQQGEERLTRVTGLTPPSSRKRGSKSVSLPPEPFQTQWVIRLMGDEAKALQETLSGLPIHWTDNLEDAVSKTLSLIKTK